jgi:uncharacterized membrane protein YhaH (DUF805 family)
MVSAQPSNERVQAVRTLVIVGTTLARQGKSDAATAVFDEIETCFGKDDSPDVREWVAKARESRRVSRLAEESARDKPAAERTPPLMKTLSSANWGMEPKQQPDWAKASARPRQSGARQTAGMAYDGPYCELPIVSTNGRLGRMRFMAWNMAFILALSIFVVILLKPKGNMNLATFAAPLMIVTICFLFSVCATVRRLHDMNLSGWWILFLFVLSGWASYRMQQSPSIRSMTVFLLAQFLIFMFLCIVPGNQGINDHGHPPPPNSSSVYVLAGIFILGAAISFGGTAVQLKEVAAMLSARDEAQNDGAQAQTQGFGKVERETRPYGAKR